MTTPTGEFETAAPPDGYGTEATVTVAVLGLVLVAIEAKVIADITAALAALASAYATVVVSAIGLDRHRHGTELLSRKDVHAKLVREIDKARKAVRASISAGYTAAAQVALVRTARDLKKLGHDVFDELPDLGGTLDALMAEIDTAFGDAQTDFQDTVRDAFDGVIADAEADPNPVRILVTKAAIERVTRRLRQRLNASGTTGVHRGARDAQVALFEELADINPYITLRKVWRVTSVRPCGMCSALDGTEVGIGDQFDHHANDGDEQTTRPVYRDLLGPPRHPNCRCQLELVTV